MKKTFYLFITAAVALALLLPSGCKILSGTTMVEKMFRDLSASSSNSFYYEAMDITDEQDWIDHKDDITDIDNVGFELWVTNNSSVANEFDCYVAAFSSSLTGASSKSMVADSATHVLVSVPLAATGQTFVGYAASFSHITNLETLKTLAESGQFKFFAMSEATPIDFTVDSVKVVITLTAGI
jgi:hypothetical protein